METLLTFKPKDHAQFFTQSPESVQRYDPFPTPPPLTEASSGNGVGFGVQQETQPVSVELVSDEARTLADEPETVSHDLPNVSSGDNFDRIIVDTHHSVADDPRFAGIVSEWTREDSKHAIRSGINDEIDDFKTYAVPISSTDYKGLEAIDSRLVDRVWRLNNLYMVVNEDGELVKFKLRPAQEKLLRNLHYRNIVLKARQLGFTTFICIFLLDYALFNRNMNIGIVAHTQTDASTIFRKVKLAWDNFPAPIKDYLALGTAGDSKVEYEFTNGSVMRIATSLRSGTYQAVLVTEFGKICAHFPEKADEIITGTLPAVPKNGLVFIESTAEGEGGHFWDMCMDAMESDRLKRPLTSKEFKFFFFPWYQNPANNIDGQIEVPPDVNQYLDGISMLTKVRFTQTQRNWYYLDQKIQKSKMKQEHPSTPEEAFLSTGNKLFNSEALEKQRLSFVLEPIMIEGDFVYYRRYKKGHVYALGCDPSLGVKRDHSTIVVIDLTEGEVVFTYKSNTVDPVNLAYDIKKVALYYGGCIAAVEANNTGIGVNITLKNIYPNIFTQVREDMLETSVTAKLGWLSTGGSKPKMMYELSDAIEGDLKLRDLGIILEAKSYNKEDALTSANDEKTTTRHFDLLIACGIAWQMRIHAKRGMAEPDEVARVETHRQERLNRKHSNYR